MKLKQWLAAAAVTVLVTAAACPALAECPKKCTAPKPRVTCAQREADKREAAYLASIKAYQNAIARQEQAYLDSIKAYQKAIAQREQAYLDSLYNCR